MTDLSTRPDSRLRGGRDATADHPATTGTSRWKMLVGAMGLLVVLWVGIEVYDVVVFDGFGPGAGEGTPGGEQGPGPTVGTPGGPAGADQGPDAGVHRPPAGGHG